MHFPVGFVYHDDETPWPKNSDGTQETKYILSQFELILRNLKTVTQDTSQFTENCLLILNRRFLSRNQIEQIKQMLIVEWTMRYMQMFSAIDFIMCECVYQIEWGS